MKYIGWCLVIVWTILICQVFTYEALQACASISVSKLYNFHLPYLVTFFNTFLFCLVPKYLEIPVVTKYFVKICLFL